MTGTIIGTGACAASHVMENDDLAQFVDTSDAWITERTGIKRRHIAENETVSSLAVCAAKKALLDAEIFIINYENIVIGVNGQASKTEGIEFPFGAAFGIPFVEQVAFGVKDQHAAFARIVHINIS